MEQTKYTTKVRPYRGKNEEIIKELSNDTVISLSDNLLYINIDYTHYMDLIDIDTNIEESDDNQILQIENRICEETYLDRNQITSISKQIENCTTDTKTEYLYLICITARGTISNIRCKHKEEAEELFKTLVMWWRFNTYPEILDDNIQV